MRGPVRRNLIYLGFIAEALGPRRLPDLVRYLRGILRRLDNLGGNQARDAERMASVRRVAAEYEAARRELPPAARSRADVLAIRWQIEELRVSLFAQVLGTPGTGLRRSESGPHLRPCSVVPSTSCLYG